MEQEQPTTTPPATPEVNQQQNIQPDVTPQVSVEAGRTPPTGFQEPVVSAENPIPNEDPVDENENTKTEDDGKHSRFAGWKSTASTILILIAAPLFAILLTTFVFQSYEVDGESMETTLQNHDRLIVWKAPVTIANTRNQHFIPKRAQIIIFHKQGLPNSGEIGDKQLIKRVIGLPGERVVVRDNEITVYNQQNPEGFNPDKIGNYKITSPITPGNVDLIVPDGEVFVCGDNRTNSLDSRAFGPVASHEIVGELSFRIFPFNKTQHFK